MKKLAMGLLSLVLVLAFLGISQAGNKKIQMDALADIIPVGCSEPPIGQFGTSLLVAWDWTDGTDQTKFGGDAVYMVEATPDGETYEWLAVEVELVKYERGTPAEDYVGKMVYRCSNAQTDFSGSCDGAVLDLKEALRAAAAAKLESDSVDIGDYIRQWVYVKAINPSFYDPGEKRQNYPLVDVCEDGDDEPGDDEPGDDEPGDDEPEVPAA
jgi:hypothetical protein